MACGLRCAQAAACDGCGGRRGGGGSGGHPSSSSLCCHCCCYAAAAAAAAVILAQGGSAGVNGRWPPSALHPSLHLCHLLPLPCQLLLVKHLHEGGDHEGEDDAPHELQGNEVQGSAPASEGNVLVEGDEPVLAIHDIEDSDDSPGEGVKVGAGVLVQAPIRQGGSVAPPKHLRANGSKHQDEHKEDEDEGRGVQRGAQQRGQHLVQRAPAAHQLEGPEHAKHAQHAQGREAAAAAAATPTAPRTQPHIHAAGHHNGGIKQVAGVSSKGARAQGQQAHAQLPHKEGHKGIVGSRQARCSSSAGASAVAGQAHYVGQHHELAGCGEVGAGLQGAAQGAQGGRGGGHPGPVAGPRATGSPRPPGPPCCCPGCRQGVHIVGHAGAPHLPQRHALQGHALQQRSWQGLLCCSPRSSRARLQVHYPEGGIHHHAHVLVQEDNELEGRRGGGGASVCVCVREREREREHESERESVAVLCCTHQEEPQEGHHWAAPGPPQRHKGHRPALLCLAHVGSEEGPAQVVKGHASLGGAIGQGVGVGQALLGLQAGAGGIGGRGVHWGAEGGGACSAGVGGRQPPRQLRPWRQGAVAKGLVRAVQHIVDGPVAHPARQHSPGCAHQHSCSVGGNEGGGGRGAGRGSSCQEAGIGGSGGGGSSSCGCGCSCSGCSVCAGGGEAAGRVEAAPAQRPCPQLHAHQASHGHQEELQQLHVQHVAHDSQDAIEGVAQGGQQAKGAQGAQRAQGAQG